MRGPRSENTQIVTEDGAGTPKTTHVESIQQPLLRNGVITLQTPAMISQPNIMTIRQHQHPTRKRRTHETTHNRDFPLGPHSTTTPLPTIELVGTPSARRSPSLSCFENAAEE